jgi:hypothetical protein
MSFYEALRVAVRTHPATVRVGKEFRYAGAFVKNQPKILGDAIKNTSNFEHISAPTNVPRWNLDSIPHLESFLPQEVAQPLAHATNFAIRPLASSTGIRGLDRLTTFPKNYLNSVKHHRNQWWKHN